MINFRLWVGSCAVCDGRPLLCVFEESGKIDKMELEVLPEYSTRKFQKLIRLKVRFYQN